MYIVLKKQSFGFKKPILTKTLATGKFDKTNLQNYASDILLYVQLRTIRWLSKY